MKNFKDLSASLYETKRHQRAINSPGVDKTTAQELVLYITNDGQLYRSRTTPIIKNMQRKINKDQYNDQKAEKAFMYLVKDGIKKYEKEHANPGWAKQVDKKTKEAIAQELLDYYMDEIGEESVPRSDGEELEEMNYMVDIDGIGKVIVDGKSSSEVKVKIMKKLRKPDDIKGIERMTDPEKKKYFRTKATGKDEGE